MRRLYAVAGVVAILALAAHSSGATPPVRPHYHPGPDGPVCAYGPHTETVKKTTYGTKEEPFCVKRVTFSSLFSCRQDCAADCVTRTKTRLVKCETTEESVKMKCAVEPTPRGPAWIHPTVSHVAPKGLPTAIAPPLPPPVITVSAPGALPIPVAPVVPTAPAPPEARIAPVAPMGPLAPLPPR